VKPGSTDAIDRGVRKAAIAVLALGPDLAKEIFSVLSSEEVQQILTASESIRDVRAEEVLQVLEELNDRVGDQIAGISGHDYLLHQAAAAALGSDKLALLLSDEQEQDEARRHLINAARKDPAAFAQVLANEHPQVVAIVGSVLDPKVAAKIWDHLSEDLKTDAVRRIATLRSVPSQVMTEVIEAVGKAVSVPSEEVPIKIDGLDSAVQLVKSVGSGQQKAIFEQLKETDEVLAEEIRRRLFVFDDIINLHARDVQRVLREVDSQILPMALKSSSEELKEHILGNMSGRAADMIREDMEVLGPVTVKRVLEAQETIVDSILRMADEGKVNLNPEDSV
jgi:flagellar motor switch protein FliG